jgi:ABC-type oligopeptide transport system ATPase subunit
MLRYRPATYEPAVEEAEEEPQQPATLKLKKRLPSANNTREATRKNLLLKQQVSQQSEPNDFARLLPKNIYQDKEFLYSELLQVKRMASSDSEQYNSAA